MARERIGLRGWRVACVFHGYTSLEPGFAKAWKKKDYGFGPRGPSREYEIETKASRLTGTIFDDAAYLTRFFVKNECIFKWNEESRDTSNLFQQRYFATLEIIRISTLDSLRFNPRCHTKSIIKNYVNMKKINFIRKTKTSSHF